MFIISLLQLAVTPGFPSSQLLRSLEKTLRLVLALPHRAAAWPNIALPCGLPAWPFSWPFWNVGKTMEDLSFFHRTGSFGVPLKKVQIYLGSDPGEFFIGFSCFSDITRLRFLSLLGWCAATAVWSTWEPKSHAEIQAPIQDQYFLSLPRISVRTSLVGTRTRRRDWKDRQGWISIGNPTWLFCSQYMQESVFHLWHPPRKIEEQNLRRQVMIKVQISLSLSPFVFLYTIDITWGLLIHCQAWLHDQDTELETKQGGLTLRI